MRTKRNAKAILDLLVEAVANRYYAAPGGRING